MIAVWYFSISPVTQLSDFQRSLSSPTDLLQLNLTPVFIVPVPSPPEGQRNADQNLLGDDISSLGAQLRNQLANQIIENRMIDNRMITESPDEQVDEQVDEEPKPDSTWLPYDRS